MKNIVGGLVVAIVAGVILGSAFLLCLLYWRKSRKSKKDRQISLEMKKANRASTTKAISVEDPDVRTDIKMSDGNLDGEIINVAQPTVNSESLKDQISVSSSKQLIKETFIQDDQVVTEEQINSEPTVLSLEAGSISRNTLGSKKKRRRSTAITGKSIETTTSNSSKVNLEATSNKI